MTSTTQDAPVEPDVNQIRKDEYFLLDQITQKLQEAQEAERSAQQKKVEAIALTRRVWSHFCDSLVVPDNRMPDEMRKLLLSLGLWIERETANVTDGKGDLEALINVNRHIAEGLKPNA